MTIQFEISDHLYKCLKKRIELDAASELDMLVDKGIVIEQEPKAEWIPVSERLPERAKGGCVNWHTDKCIVCMYGKGIYDYELDEENYEILTGNFIEFVDEETGKKELGFEPDRFTLFVPDEWNYFIFDKDFKSHLSKEQCIYYTDDSCTETEFHDRYYQVLAWMPLPEPYKESEVEE